MNIKRNIAFLVLIIPILFSGCNKGSMSSTINGLNEKVKWHIAYRTHFEDSTYTIAGFVNEKRAALLAFHGEMYYTENSGKTWSKGINEPQFIHYASGLDFLDETTAYCCGDLGTIKKTEDGGKTWKRLPQYDPDDPDYYEFISFPNERQGWVASTKKLGSTSDSGNTWTTLALPSSCKNIAAIDLRTPSEGCIIDTKGSLFFTKDSGETWTEKSLGLKDEKIIGITPSPAAVIRFIDETNGVAVYFNSERKIRALSTNDGGDTWTYEEIPDVRFGYLHLTRNMRLLSVASPLNKEITVLKR